MESKPQAGLGEYLRGEREKRHITIEQVASATKINIKLLHALESDNYDALPAKPFVRGFVTSYARYIGLEPKEVLQQFDLFLDERSGQKFKRPEESPHLFVEKDPQADNSKTALSIVMISFIVVAIVVFLFVKPSLKHKRSRAKQKAAVTNEEVVTVVAPSAPTAVTRPSPTPSAVAAVVPKPSPSPIATPKPATVATPKPSPAATPKAAATPGAVATPAPSPTAAVSYKVPNLPFNEVKVRLTVRAVVDSWVRYQADDFPIQGFILRKDKTIYIRGRQSIRFTTGNPTGLEISYGTQEFTPFPKGKLSLVVPQEATSQYEGQLFVPVNPQYLSTPSQ